MLTLLPQLQHYCQSCVILSDPTPYVLLYLRRVVSPNRAVIIGFQRRSSFRYLRRRTLLMRRALEIFRQQLHDLLHHTLC